MANPNIIAIIAFLIVVSILIGITLGFFWLEYVF